MAVRDEEDSIGIVDAPKEPAEVIELAELGLDSSVEEEDEEFDVHKGRGIKYYLICVLMGSLMTASSKLAMRDTDQFIVMFFRMAGTFIIATLWMIYKRVDHLFWGPPGLRRILLLRGSVGTINLALAYFAVQYLPLPDYSLLSFLAPQLTALAAHFILGEPYYWVQAVASGVSFVGVIVMTPSFIFGDHLELPEGVTQRQHAIAVAVVLLQNFGNTSIFLLLRKIGTRISPYTIVSHYSLQVCTFSASVLTFRVLRGEEVHVPSKITTWLILVFIGLVGFLFQFLMSLAIARERASALTQFDYMVLIYMMLWQFLLFHTLPDLVSVGGGALILVGVLWASRARPKD